MPGRHLGLRTWHRCGAQLPSSALPLVDHRLTFLGYDLDLRRVAQDEPPQVAWRIPRALDLLLDTPICVLFVWFVCNYNCLGALHVREQAHS